MSNQMKGSVIRQANYGLKVERAAATLPATTTATIFNVTGGRVMILLLVGEVTTVMSGTATNLSTNHVATGGGGTTALSTATAVTSLAVGTPFVLTALNAAAAVTGVAANPNRLTVVPGAIQITTSATNTGAMRWTLLYVPLDDGAVVTAA